MKETLEDIACGIAIFLVFATLLWAILAIPAGAQTIRVIRPIFLSENISSVDSILVIQQKPDNPKYGWITDSIKWVPTDTTFAGDCRCEHDWVLDATRPGNVDIHLTFGFEIMDCNKLNPDGKHCNEHQSATREKICRKCLFSVVESENRFQHFVVPPKSEFEILKERQRGKQ